MKSLDSNIQDQGMTLIVWATGGCITLTFLWLVGDILWFGIAKVSWSFFVSPPQQAGREGGIGPILVSTSLIVAVCMTVAFPIGIGAAMFLAEFTRPDLGLGRMIRVSLDILAGVPSIVFGLFGNAVFCQVLGLGFSILSGGLTLACMVLPLLIRTTEEGLRAIPHEHRLSAAALGLSKCTTVWSVLLPGAIPGLLVGCILGLGRATAETAALIFTSGYVARMPESFLDSGRTLSIHIYDLAMNVAGGNPNAYASALVLISLLLCVNVVSSWIAERWATPNPSFA